MNRVIVIAAVLAMSAPAVAQDSVVVWTGGIGVEERDAAPKEGTKLVFFVETGNFLSDVQVSIKDAAGKEIVNAVSKGPWMILNLAPGRYTVHASVGDQAQGGTIEVSGNSQQFAYMFKAQ
jgi:hypothetical protein